MGKFYKLYLDKADKIIKQNISTIYKVRKREGKKSPIIPPP